MKDDKRYEDLFPKYIETDKLANFLYRYENIVIKLIQDLASVGVEMNDRIISKITSTLNHTIQKIAQDKEYNNKEYDRKEHNKYISNYYLSLENVNNLRFKKTKDNIISNKLKTTYSLLDVHSTWCDRFATKKFLEGKVIEKMSEETEKMITQGLKLLQAKDNTPAPAPAPAPATATGTGGRNVSLKKTVRKKKNKGGKKTQRIN